METGPIKGMDSFPYRHSVGEVMSAPLAKADPSMPLAQAAEAMTSAGVSSLVVVDDDGKPVGIVTERDMLRGLVACAAKETGAPQPSVGDTMSGPVVTVHADAFLYVAMGRMARHGFRHLVAVDGQGRAVGVITNRALVKLRSAETLQLGDQVGQAESAAEMAAARERLPELARHLLAEDVAAQGVARVISAVYRDMTRRAARLAERGMIADGKGAAPAPWALLVLGSGGRGESLLSPDQDNAIVHAGSDADDIWFAEVARRLSGLLDAAGVPYCKGHVMASETQWRKSLDGWRAELAHWTGAADPEALLSVDIFYDFQCVHGDEGLAARLRDAATTAARASRPFLTMLGTRLDDFEPPFGLLGGWRTVDGRVDLKMNGLLPIVSGLRIMALQNGIDATSTHGRLEALRQAGVINAGDGDAIADAHALVLGVILDQQLADIADGRAPGNTVDPKRLTRRTAGALKAALKHLTGLKLLVRDSLSR